LRRLRASPAAATAALLLLAGGAALLGRNGGSTLDTAGVPLFLAARETLVRTATAEGYLQAVESTPITVPVSFAGAQRIAWLAPDGSAVRKGDVVVRFDPTSLELDLADGEADLEIARMKIREAADKSELEGQNLLLDTTLAEKEQQHTESFAPRDPQIYSGHEIIDSEIDRELAREKVDNARDKSVTAALKEKTELDLLQIDRSRAEVKLQKAKTGLASLEVRAPHDGVLILERGNYGEKVRPGTEVWPGQKVAEIPDPSRMQARVYVLDAEAGSLKAGCRATLTVDAHAGKIYVGKIDRVDALAKKRVWNVPVEYFEAVLVPERTDREAMKPGQGVVAEIVLEEIPGALAIPPQAVFLVEGKQVVFCKEGSQLTMREVVTGARSLSRIQILKGLKERDEVALRDPRRKPPETSGPRLAGRSSSSPVKEKKP